MGFIEGSLSSASQALITSHLLPNISLFSHISHYFYITLSNISRTLFLSHPLSHSTASLSIFIPCHFLSFTSLHHIFLSSLSASLSCPSASHSSLPSSRPCQNHYLLLLYTFAYHHFPLPIFIFLSHLYHLMLSSPSSQPSLPLHHYSLSKSLPVISLPPPIIISPTYFHLLICIIPISSPSSQPSLTSHLPLPFSLLRLTIIYIYLHLFSPFCEPIFSLHHLRSILLSPLHLRLTSPPSPHPTFEHSHLFARIMDGHGVARPNAHHQNNVSNAKLEQQQHARFSFQSHNGGFNAEADRI